jgi:hypothetical protein
MNREGKSYRSLRCEGNKDKVNGSVIVVTRSVSWNEVLGDCANYTHHCLVLECPLDPAAVGREIRLDERMYTSHETGGQFISTWEHDDGYFEI